jgi:hypothetical protein
MALAILAVIFACRSLFIHFHFIEIVFTVSGIILAIIYSSRVTKTYQTIITESPLFGYLIGAYRLSIVLFLISLSLAPFTPLIAEFIGILSFGLFLIFGAVSLSKKTILLRGERISPIKYVLTFRDASSLLITVLIIFSGYIGLTKIDVVPRLYSSEYPQGYIELIEQAESGKENQINGKFKHELFKKRYDDFVEKNLDEYQN